MSTQRRRTAMGIAAFAIAAATTTLVAPMASAAATISISPTPGSFGSSNADYHQCEHWIYLNGLDSQFKNLPVQFTDNGQLISTWTSSTPVVDPTNREPSADWFTNGITGVHTITAAVSGGPTVSTTVTITAGHPGGLSSLSASDECVHFSMGT